MYVLFFIVTNAYVYKLHCNPKLLSSGYIIDIEYRKSNVQTNLTIYDMILLLSHIAGVQLTYINEWGKHINLSVYVRARLQYVAFALCICDQKRRVPEEKSIFVEFDKLRHHSTAIQRSLGHVEKVRNFDLSVYYSYSLNSAHVYRFSKNANIVIYTVHITVHLREKAITILYILSWFFGEIY